MPEYVVRYTPGPPATGTLTTERVAAESASAAEAIICARHRWVMVHSVEECAS